MQRELTMKRAAFAAAAMAALAAFAEMERVGDWAVSMPAEAIKVMSSSERTCANRALKMNESGQHRSAAAEWKRFENEFVSADPIAQDWASFFQAYSLDRANDRYKAIQLYSDTIELDPESMSACASLFFRGNAYGTNGNGAKALADYRELVDNQLFQKHPLAYEAHRRLGWAALHAGKLDEAVEEWKTITELKPEGNRRIWNDVKRDLKLLEDVADPDRRLAEIASDDKLKPGQRLAAVRDLRNNLWGNVSGMNPIVRVYFSKHLGKAKNEDEAKWIYLNRILDMFEKRMKPIYSEANAMWEYDITRFDMYCTLRRDKIDALVNEIAGNIAKTADAGARQGRAIELMGRLLNLGRGKEAKLLLQHISDPVQRGWKGYDIGWRMGDGKFAVESLKPLEAMPDTKVSDEAKRAHARCCQQLLGDYDTAIKLYEEAPAPPGTLWSVADCHRSAGRKPRAQATLDEICSIFPNDAPNAMLRKGDWYRDDGDTKMAIGCYRRILAHADWKKSGAASQAHQRLEAMGIATGGAVLNEVH